MGTATIPFSLALPGGIQPLSSSVAPILNGAGFAGCSPGEAGPAGDYSWISSMDLTSITSPLDVSLMMPVTSTNLPAILATSWVFGPFTR